MSELNISVKRLPHAEGLALPARETDGAAGLDLIAAVEEASPIGLSPGERRLVPTGLILQLPPGYEGQVRPRSGLALRHGITVLNAPGTVDADYRGEVQVLLINLGREDFTITRGMRIAQLVIARVELASLCETDVVSVTQRGAGGFGSTGLG
jgi:dUTP pyrophosphatase